MANLRHVIYGTDHERCLGSICPCRSCRFAVLCSEDGLKWVFCNPAIESNVKLIGAGGTPEEAFRSWWWIWLEKYGDSEDGIFRGGQIIYDKTI